MPRSVKVTNPAASQLPKGLGEFGRPAQPEPITPIQPSRLAQLRHTGKGVRVTSRKAVRSVGGDRP